MHVSQTANAFGPLCSVMEELKDRGYVLVGRALLQRLPY